MTGDYAAALALLRDRIAHVRASFELPAIAGPDVATAIATVQEGIAVDCPLQERGDLMEAIGWHYLGRAHSGDGTEAVAAKTEFWISVQAFKFVFLNGVGAMPNTVLPAVAMVSRPEAEALYQRAIDREPDLLPRVVHLWQQIAEAGQPENPDTALSFERLNVSAYRLFQHSGNPRILRVAVNAAQRAVALTPADVQLRADRIANLAMVSWEFREYAHDGALDALEAWCREALAGTPADHSEYAGRLGLLGNVLIEQFGKHRVGATIDEAIDLFTLASGTVGLDLRTRALLLMNLANALRIRAGETSSAADAQASVAVADKALQIYPAHGTERTTVKHQSFLARLQLALLAPTAATLRLVIAAGQELLVQPNLGREDQVLVLGSLVEAWLRTYKLTAERDDLDAAVAAARAALPVSTIGSSRRRTAYRNLAGTLLERFLAYGEETDLRDAQQAHAWLVAYDSDGGYSAAVTATLRRVLFELSGERAQIDAAVAAGRATDDPVVLEALAAALAIRGRIYADLDDLHEAITITQSLRAEAVDPDERNRLGAALSAHLRQRYEFDGAPADLDASIGLAWAAMKTDTAVHATKWMGTTNLAVALTTRFERSGNLDDANEAIRLSRAAIAVMPPGHPYRGRLHANLCLSLRLRFEWTGALADLDEAVEHGRSATRTARAVDAEHTRYLANFAHALHTRFARTGQRCDIEEAVTVARSAVTSARAAGRLDTARLLPALASALMRRYLAYRRQLDLDQAVDLFREAASAATLASQDSALNWTNTGTALVLRSETHEVADLEQAVEAHRNAVRASRPHGGYQGFIQYNLGLALVKTAQAGGHADLQEGINALTAAASDAYTAPHLRAHAAHIAASVLVDSDLCQAASLAEMAVHLLPRIAPRELARDDQETALSGFAGLAGFAAALVLATSAPASRAVQVLESGRAVLLSQALATRTDLSDLHDAHPELAERFEIARRQLSALPEPTAVELNRSEVANGIEAIILEVRRLPGFATFLAPPDEEELRRAARPGPIVCFNITDVRSDALVVTSSGIALVPLPGASQRVVRNRVEELTAILAILRESASGLPHRIRAQQSLNRLLEWLYDEIMAPVLDSLGPSSEPSRVWLCPGGLLGRLPLHAAGHHRVPGADRRTVLDRAVVSYTPTVRALEHARSRTSAQSPAAGALIVAMPQTPAADELRFAMREAQLVAGFFPQRTILTTEQGGALRVDGPATAEAVLRRLGAHDVVHFACHGVVDTRSPSHSALLLADHESDLLTVARISAVQVVAPRMAFLSACQTAVTDNEALLDESIHLTSAFQLAGFPSVIGTMWAIQDAAAADAAAAFYSRAVDDGTTADPARIAAALRGAVLELRNANPLRPDLWAAYLHAGA